MVPWWRRCSALAGWTKPTPQPEAKQKKLDCLHLNYALYELAFLRGDTWR